MKTINDIIKANNEAIEAYINSQCNKLSAKDCGLDERAGNELFINNDCIIVKNARLPNLNYYGGFQYVSSVDTITLGQYTIFCKQMGIADIIDNAFLTINAMMDNL